MSLGLVALRSGPVMQTKPLAGRLVLIVEDELLIALDLQAALRIAGAKVVSAGYVEAGLYMTDHPALSAAVVDLHLGKGDGVTVCQRLQRLGIPFVVHTAYSAEDVRQRCPTAPIIKKPARPELIVAALMSVLG
jgi:DNA-binding response OmpR family regulator